MTQETDSRNLVFIPPQPIPPEAKEFSKRVHGLLDGQPKDESTVNQALEGMDGMLDMIAAGLYSLASMLVGEGEQSVQLVEQAIARADLPACSDPKRARQSSRRALTEAALQLMVKRNPESLAFPEGFRPVSTCIEDDDLDAAGVSKEELEQMMSGPDRARLRNWLAGLSAPLRTIFALRAVAGFTPQETASMLVTCGGPKAANWSAGVVRAVFRQALCSLASQMIQASAVR